MAPARPALFAFNRGVVSKLALGRVDLDRMRLSAQTQTNWLPRTLGPMKLRPGLGYVTRTRSNTAAVLVDFVKSADDTALIEVTNDSLRFLIDDEPLERVSVATAVTNGDFGASGSWTLATTGSATATISGGVLTMAGVSDGGRATCTQELTIDTDDRFLRHALRIEVTRGPISFRIGTTAGAEDILEEESLDTGTHSLAFSPDGTTAFIRFETTSPVTRIVTSCTIESAGVVVLPAPWGTEDMPYIRHQQSGDVVFVAADGYQQRRIERRDTDSWSIVLYKPNDGPFGAVRTAEVRLTPGATSGNTTLTADRAFFRDSNVGSLFRLFHEGQVIDDDLSAEDTYTGTIRVTGVSRAATGAFGAITETHARDFQYTISGTWSGTLTLQRSFTSDVSGFTDVSTTTSNTTSPVTFADGLDNQIVWYRFGFKTGAYSSGTATITLTYGAGGGYGVCRVVAFTSATVVDVEVLSDFKNVTSTDDWQEGQWSDRRGWPSGVALFDGRLWWAGQDRIWGSISDSYNAFDPEFEGDAGPINRTIGVGPIEDIAFMLPLTRMLIGNRSGALSVRSSNFDAPLTPTDFTIRECTTQGAANVPAVKVDTRGLFVQGSGNRLYEVAYSFEAQDYIARDLTELVPEIGSPGIVRLLVQRQPDTRIHCIRSDGTVACLLYEPASETLCWWNIETEGVVESGCVLPGAEEDRVYYVVKRGNLRYIERFAMESECVGGAINKLVDCHVIYSGFATDTLPASHLVNGAEVVVWTNGVALDGTFTVAGSTVVIDREVTSAVYGYGYDATFKSAKLAYGAMGGSSVTQKKRVVSVGLVLADTHPSGIRIGQDESLMDELPDIERDDEVAENTVREFYDEQSIPVNGAWDTDARLIITASAPKPATVLGAIISLETREN